MKTKRNRFIAGLLAVGLLFSACASSPDEPESNSTPENSAKVEESSEQNEPETITILTSINVDTEGTDVNDNDHINYIRERTGINIQFINDAANYDQKMNTFMASNDLPDALMLMGDNQRLYLAKWVSEEMLMPLDDLLPEYGPHLLSEIKEEAWEVARQDGITYAVPFQRYDSTPYMTFLRKDWLENLGIDPEEDLKTIDDWYDMLKRFVTDDPDQNGVDDTFGIVSTTSGTHFTNFSLLDSFGAARSKVVDGELLPNYMLPEYKEWLKFYNRLYEERILDPEYVVNTGTQMWEKVASGKYGMFLWMWGLQEYLSKGLERDDLVAVPPPVREDGSQASYIYSSPNRHMMAITADSEKADTVLKFFDWSCTEEGAIFLYAGLEGKDYDIVDDEIILREDRKEKNLGWRQLTICIEMPNVDEEPIRGILEQSFGTLGIEHLNLATEYGGYDDLDLYCPVFEELTQYDLDTQVSEFTDKAITGAIDIDAEWDNYIDTLRKSGADVKIQLSTDWYNTSYNK